MIAISVLGRLEEAHHSACLCLSVCLLSRCVACYSDECLCGFHLGFHFEIGHQRRSSALKLDCHLNATDLCTFHCAIHAFFVFFTNFLSAVRVSIRWTSRRFCRGWLCATTLLLLRVLCCCVAAARFQLRVRRLQRLRYACVQHMRGSAARMFTTWTRDAKDATMRW